MPPTGDQEVADSTLPGRQLSFMEIFDYEIFSVVILSFLLIEEGQLSVSGKRISTIVVSH